MKQFKSFLLSIGVFIGLINLSACTYSTTFTPGTNNKESAIIDSIDNAYHFQDIKLQEKRSSGSNGTHITLTAKFINGMNIPTDDDKLTALEKQLALQVKQMLKDPNQIESYTILFVTSEQSGIETTNTSIGHEFSADDLK